MSLFLLCSECYIAARFAGEVGLPRSMGRLRWHASPSCQKDVKVRRFVLGMMFVLVLSACNATGLPSPTSTATPSPSLTSPPPTATPQASVTPDSTQDLTGACFGSSLPTFADYTTWTKVNPKPVPGHETYVNIYVNDLAKGIYTSASGKTFPACAAIVKEQLASQTSTDVTALTVMVKMPAGYDPANNDWWWAMYDPTGKVAQESGKLSVCSSCHQPAAASDYVFSQKVMQESKP
jgi:hypothetical protein